LRKILFALIIGFCCALTPCYSQTFQDLIEEADSLKDINPARSNELLATILKADSIEVPPLIRAKTLQLLGLSSMYNNQFRRADDYFSRADRLYTLIPTEDKSIDQRASLTMDVGRSLTWQGQYEMALEKFLFAKQLYEKTINLRGIATTLNAIAVIYGQFNEDFESALKTFKEALAINSELDDTVAVARVMQNVGQIYELTGQFDSALYYLRVSNSLSSRFRDYRSLAVGNNLLGAVFYSLDELDSSEYYYEEAIRLDIQNQDSIGLIFDFYLLSSTLISKEDFEKAEYYANEAYERTKDLGVKFSAAKNLSLIHDARGDHKTALKYHREFKTLEDSVRSEDNRELISELQAKYETTKREAEIARLESENQLANIREGESRRLMVIAVAASVVLISFLVVFYILRLKKSRAEKQATEQQYDALQKRYIELLNGPQKFALADDLELLNGKVVNPLTEREFETLSLGLQGKSNKEIAGRLFVSESTVKFHLRNVYNKLGVANRKEALEYVVKSS